MPGPSSRNRVTGCRSHNTNNNYNVHVLWLTWRCCRFCCTMLVIVYYRNTYLYRNGYGCLDASGRWCVVRACHSRNPVDRRPRDQQQMQIIRCWCSALFLVGSNYWAARWFIMSKLYMYFSPHRVTKVRKFRSPSAIYMAKEYQLHSMVVYGWMA